VDERTEFGHPRVSCSCKQCTDPCRFIPSYLIPNDLDRLIPSHLSNEKQIEWCETNLLASPGATVLDRATGRTRNIPSLVLASKSDTDHSCVFLDAERRCTIHAIAPFGCAFFRVCTKVAADDTLSVQGLVAIDNDWHEPHSLYRAIWEHLHRIGRVSPSPAEKWKRMMDGLAKEKVT
jgi:Fe-S-cluster containining protein